MSVNTEERLVHVENLVAKQSANIDALTTAVGSLRSHTKEVFDKLDQLSVVAGKHQATQGMVPERNIMWSLGWLVGLTSIGITALTLVVRNERVITEKTHQLTEQKIETLIDSRSDHLAKIHEESNDRKDDVKRLDAELARRRDWMEEIGSRLSRVEKSTDYAREFRMTNK